MPENDRAPTISPRSGVLRIAGYIDPLNRDRFPFAGARFAEVNKALRERVAAVNVEFKEIGVVRTVAR